MNTNEYGIIYIENGKVVGLRPATHPNLAAVVDNAAIVTVLQDLASHGWARDDDAPIPSGGKVQLKIHRQVFEKPKHPSDYRVEWCDTDGTGQVLRESNGSSK